MRFALTPDARVDLLDIGEHIGRDNPDRAVTFVNELLERSEQVAELPQVYRLRPEWGESVRSARHGNYLILFETGDEGVTILRYLHSRRNITRILSGEDE